MIASYGYDTDSRVTSVTYGTGGSCASPPSNLGNLTYTYNGDGRRSAMGGSLAAVTPPGNVAGGASTTYNADNEQSNFNGVSLTYDANGNLTGDGSNTYTWDARNHLTSINSGTTASFVYDAFGRRMKKTVSGTTTQFLYDGLNPVQELSGRGAVVANLLTGLRIDEYFTRTDSSNNVSAFLADALGSTVGLVNSLGAIATNYTYEPFGATTVGGSANGNSYEFTGRENDGTGLYFYRARYYSPTLQRFVTQDPIGLAGGDTNLYGYAGNDPVNQGDPSGRGFWTGIGVGAACFGYLGYEFYSSLHQLFQQEQELGNEINNLTQQRNSCSEPDQQRGLQREIESLQQQQLDLVEQYLQGAPSFSHDAQIAACLFATRFAFLLPLP